MKQLYLRSSENIIERLYEKYERRKEETRREKQINSANNRNRTQDLHRFHTENLSLKLNYEELYEKLSSQLSQLAILRHNYKVASHYRQKISGASQRLEETTELWIEYKSNDCTNIDLVHLDQMELVISMAKSLCKRFQHFEKLTNQLILNMDYPENMQKYWSFLQRKISSCDYIFERLEKLKSNFWAETLEKSTPKEAEQHADCHTPPVVVHQKKTNRTLKSILRKRRSSTINVKRVWFALK